MADNVVIVGAGIGGLACALALARAGIAVEVLEQAATLGEVGAGLQLGPNAVRVLTEWGLASALKAQAAFPDDLRVRDACDGQTLGRLRLGSTITARYGQPYVTLHRADLHRLLLDAVHQQGGIQVHLNARLASYETLPETVHAHGENGSIHTGVTLIGADGLWSRVRSQLLGAQAVRASGHLAYRGMVPADRIPSALRGSGVTAWLGPQLHVVHYPVRQGTAYNLVAVVHGVLGQGHRGPAGDDPKSWNHAAHGSDLQRALGPVCAELLDMLQAADHWFVWALNDRPPMTGPHEHAQGRIALLGDAAHPLRPYMAQGAAMALEDAWTIGSLLQAQRNLHANQWPELLARYARTRWARNAKVQRYSTRNGTLFHATGLLRVGRNLAMATLGEQLLDNPWLYQGPPKPV